MGGVYGGGGGGGEGATAPERIMAVTSMNSSYPPPPPTLYSRDSVSPASAAEPKCSAKRSSTDTSSSWCGERGVW